MSKLQGFKTICAFFVYTLFLVSTVYAEPANLGKIKLEVQAYQNSGAYDQDLTQAIASAHTFIIDKARANKQKTHPDKLAVVLDIDETSLSNYKYMVAFGFSGTHQQWHQAIMAADAPVIKPMLSLYQDAVKKGVTVFFVTGRRETERAATTKNLNEAGYKGWQELYLRPNDYNQPSVIPYKVQARADIAKKGYTIIASIGDQVSDLKGGYAEKTFKLPNPFYYLP